MLVQIHHQNRTDPTRTILIAQRSVEAGDSIREFADWQYDAMEQNPPPSEDWQFMLCSEESSYFVRAVSEDGSEPVDHIEKQP